MSIYQMVRQKMQEKREENTKLKNIYETALKAEKEKFAKEKAKIQIQAQIDRARTTAREGTIKPFLKKLIAEAKKKHKRVKGVHPGSAFSFGSSGPDFGVNRDAFELKRKPGFRL